MYNGNATIEEITGDALRVSLATLVLILALSASYVLIKDFLLGPCQEVSDQYQITDKFIDPVLLGSGDRILSAHNQSYLVSRDVYGSWRIGDVVSGTLSTCPGQAPHFYPDWNSNMREP